LLGLKAECYHYLFEAALKLHQLGIDPADPKHGPLTQTRALPTSTPVSVSKGIGSKVMILWTVSTIFVEWFLAFNQMFKLKHD
jgi:hypothetical protein